MKTIHVAEIISEGGRQGSAEASDGSFSVHFVPGSASSKGGVTPEHLFAAAYASCFHSAILNHAEVGHFKITGSTLTARVSLTENDKGQYDLHVELRASLPGIGRANAEHLLNQAHTTCPYSKAVRGNIDVVLKLD
jgi:lipoyl-dependent peroxiredoxin